MGEYKYVKFETHEAYGLWSQKFPSRDRDSCSGSLFVSLGYSLKMDMNVTGFKTLKYECI